MSLLPLLAAVVICAAPGGADGQTATIGVFFGGESAEAKELRNGAELAAAECAGACPLMAAANGGQWSAGAGELVRLVYSEGIQAVLGPADGRSAHLAEQVVTRAKGRFLLLTPWASDPALTKIKIPWFFRLAPDDLRQAETLLDEMQRVSVRKIVMVVAESDYDCRTASEAFDKAATTRGGPQPDKVALNQEAAELDRFIAEVRGFDAEAVLVLEPPTAAARVVRRLREAGISAAFFGPHRLASAAFLDAAGGAADGMVLAAPPDASGPAAERFRARYQAAHNREPSAAAAYGYDGAAVLIDALRSGGAAGGESLRMALAATRRAGMTGQIEFDASGNRAGRAPVARVEHGHLRPIGGADLDSKQTVSAIP